MKIAIIGASSRRAKFANKAVRAFLEQGDVVYPIHPAEREVEGQTVFRSVLDVPDEIDIASLYVVPDVGMRVLEECAQKGVGEIWLNPGAESEQLLQRAAELNLRIQQVCSIRAIGRAPYEFGE
jgi:predicted CoA-binding protein